jgi:hypothetical protein
MPVVVILWVLFAAFAARDPRDRHAIATIAALTRWSKEDPKANAERGQVGLQRKFYEQTDPALPEAERQRRAHAAYRAHMARIRRARTLKGRTPDNSGAAAA